MNNQLSKAQKVTDSIFGMRTEYIRKWNKENCPPDDKIVFGDGDWVEEYGLWKTQFGAIMVRKYKNGYHPETIQQFTTELIEKLYAIQSKKGK